MNGFWHPAGADAHGASGRAPPASKKVIGDLKEFSLSADDLVEETNRTCPVCIEEYDEGGQAVMLQCSHIFHKECVREWLQKHATCPSCRYELETDCPEYERGRKIRMQQWKPRYKLSQLQKQSVHQLRILASSVSVSTYGCLEKSDLVERIVASKKIFIIAVPPPASLHITALEAMSVKEIRQLMESAGISQDGLLEKADMIARVEASNKIVIKREDESQTATNENRPPGVDAIPTSTSYSTSGGIPSHSLRDPIGANTANSREGANTEAASSQESGLTRERLMDLSLANLRQIMRAERLSLENCIEKADLVDKILKSQRRNS